MIRCPLLAALLLLSGPVLAQSVPAVPPSQPVPERPPGTSATQAPAEQVAPGADRGSLSERLSRDKGTVTPPAVDPGMSVHPPGAASGRMTVIPPPGAPGGNQNVVPK